MNNVENSNIPRYGVLLTDLDAIERIDNVLKSWVVGL